MIIRHTIEIQIFDKVVNINRAIQEGLQMVIVIYHYITPLYIQSFDALHNTS